MAKYLRDQGKSVHTPTLSPSLGQAGLDELAGQLSSFVDEAVPAAEKFDLVGFSMGGLVSRYYIQKMGGSRRVANFVTLGAPHNGSLLAWVISNPGCRQMRPGSDFLKDLNHDTSALDEVNFTSIWTPFDLSILPPASSKMPQARNEWLPIALHPLLVYDRRCFSAVAGALRP
jgi:triacylglycerol lipase